MKNNKLLFSSIFIFLVIGFSSQISGVDKEDERYQQPSLKSYKAIIDRSLSASENFEHNRWRSDARRYWSETSAKKSEANAENMLGNILFYGRGCEEDIPEAKYWLKKAAAQNNADAQFLLKQINSKEEKNQKNLSNNEYDIAITHYEGKGAPIDYNKARNSFEVSAAQNNADAQFMSGAFYYFGLGGTLQDKKKGIGYFQRAAAQNHQLAIDNLKAINNILRFRSQASFW